MRNWIFKFSDIFSIHVRVKISFNVTNESNIQQTISVIPLSSEMISGYMIVSVCVCVKHVEHSIGMWKAQVEWIYVKYTNVENIGMRKKHAKHTRETYVWVIHASIPCGPRMWYKPVARQSR